MFEEVQSVILLRSQEAFLPPSTYQLIHSEDLALEQASFPKKASSKLAFNELLATND